MSEAPREEDGGAPGLTWKRGRFVVLQQILGSSVPRLREVSGVVAGPFGIYNTRYSFELVHTPTAIPLTDLAKQKQCRELAGELRRLRIRWDSSVPSQVEGEDTPRLQATIDRARRAAYPPRDAYS